MDKWADNIPANSKPTHGASFLPLFRHITSEYPNIHPHEGDLMESTWNNSSVECLHIDAMKTWALANRISRVFFPHINKDHNVVIHQDYINYHECWIHLLQYRLRDYFEFVCHVSASSTVVFRLTKSIPSKALLDATHSCSSTVDEIEAAFEWSSGLVPNMRQHILPAKAIAYFYIGNQEMASAVIDSLIKEGHPVVGNLARAKIMVEEQKGHP